MNLKRALLLVGLTTAVVAAASMAPAASAQPEAAPSAATVRNFIRSSFCSATGTTTTFAIPSAEELESQYEAVPSQIWIDLTLFQNGYAPGTFLAAGPFPAGARPASFDWSGMLVGVEHFYRMNALFPDGWKTIGSEKITTPDCVRILRYDCHPGVNTVTMEWNVPPAAPIAGSTPVVQWIDITLGSSRFLGGFAAGRPDRRQRRTLHLAGHRLAAAAQLPDQRELLGRLQRMADPEHRTVHHARLPADPRRGIAALSARASANTFSS